MRDEVVTRKECHHHQRLYIVVVAVSSFSEGEGEQRLVSSSSIVDSTCVMVAMVELGCFDRKKGWVFLTCV